ncbi:MAG: RDD family protein [Rhizobiales bacterium]|nr:RDD family protein [Hyphomicrobiales bacterium]
MSDTAPRQLGVSWDPKPHAYDPVLHPEFFEGVLSRRVLAFLIDMVVIAMPIMLLAIFVFAFGIVTLGLGWFLFWLFPPITAIWAILYYGFTLGSAASATLGMRAMDLEMRTWYGAPAYFLLGAVHAIVFWVSISALSPFIVLVAFFNRRHRLLHDMLLGAVVINNAARAQALRPQPVSPGPAGRL